MNPEQKHELTGIINEEIKQLRDEIVRLEEASKPVAPDRALGRLSRMDAIRSQTMSEANLQSAKARLKQLEAALKNIHDPDFGECQQCGAQIPFARLMLVPQTPYCVVCAQKKDH